MDCSCEIDVHYEDGEPVVCRSEKIVTAKKQHKCHECYRIIVAGEQYERAKWICDGRWELHKTCSDCLSLRKQFFSKGWLYGCLQADVEMFVDDVGGEVPEDCIARLTPAARDWICGLIEDAW